MDAGPRFEVRARRQEAGLAIWTGDLDGALAILNPLLAHTQEHPLSRVEALSRLSRCQTLVLMGRIEQARPFLLTYEDLPEPQFFLFVLRVNLEFALAAGEPEAASEHALRVPEVTGLPASSGGRWATERWRCCWRWAASKTPNAPPP